MSRLPPLDEAQSAFVRRRLEPWLAREGAFAECPWLWAWWTCGARKTRLAVEALRRCTRGVVVLTSPSLLLLRQFFRDYVRGNLAYLGLRREEVLMVCSHRPASATNDVDSAEDARKLNPLRWADETNATVCLGSRLPACPTGVRLVLSTAHSLHHVAAWDIDVAALMVDEADLTRGWSGLQSKALAGHGAGFSSEWRSETEWRNTFGAAARAILARGAPALLLTASRNPELLAACGPERRSERTHRDAVDAGVCVTGESGAAALRRLLGHGLAAAYYDSCQQLRTVVQDLRDLEFPPGFVLGVTWTENHYGGPAPAGPLFLLLSDSRSFECLAHRVHEEGANKAHTVIVRFNGAPLRQREPQRA